MRILHVITSLNRGGAEIHLLNLVSEQVKNGYKVQVIFWKKNANLIKFFKKINVSTYCLNKNSFFFEKNIIFNFIFCCLRLNKIIKLFNPNILHAHLPFSELISYFNLILKKNIKFIISKHIDTVYFSKDNNRKSFFGKKLELIVSHRAKKIICISDAVKKFLSSKYMGIKKKKLIKVYYGLDFKIYNDNKISSKLKKLKIKLRGKKIIGTISRLVPQKRIDVMIKAFSQYNTNYENSSYLIIVGKGAEKENLKKLSNKLKINDKIIWIDYLDDIKSFFSLIDIFCLTSEHEGFGIVTLEAFYNKKPIICTHAGSLPEIVKNDYNGICLRKNKLHLLPKYFHQLMFKKKAKFLVKNAFNILNEKFTNKKMFKQTDRIYRNN